MTPVPETASPVLPHTCSVWAGIGGHRRWSHAMPQLGTAHAASFGGAPDRHFAWVQWWVRDDLSSGPVPLVRPHVRPNDVMLCWLEIKSPTEVRFVLRNPTLGERKIYRMSRSGSPRAVARGVSAQWIVERPRDLVTHRDLHPLPDFGEVRFDRCAAASRGRDQVPGPARLMRMVDRVSVPEAPERVRPLSKPRKGPGRGIVRVRYTGS